MAKTVGDFFVERLKATDEVIEIANRLGAGVVTALLGTEPSWKLMPKGQVMPGMA